MRTLAYSEEYIEGVLHKRKDPTTRKVYTYAEDGTTVVSEVDFTPEENADADADAFEVQVDNNKESLTDLQQLQGRLTRLAAYSTDVEIVAALARANSTAPTTQELNRLLKVMLRREQRLTAALSMLLRLVDPELLLDVSDTTDA